MISVFLPVHKNPTYLEQTLQSLVDQTYKEFKVYVYGDGASSEVRKLVETITSPYSKMFELIWDEENLGVGFRFLEFCRRADGIYFAMIGHDDAWRPSFLSRMVKAFEIAGVCEILFSNLVEIDSVGKPRTNRLFDMYGFFHRSNTNDFGHPREKELNPLEGSLEANNNELQIKVINGAEFRAKNFGSNKISALSAFGRVAILKKFASRNVTSDYLQDWWLWSLLQENQNIGFLNESLVEYRIHDYNLSINGQASMVEAFDRSCMRLATLEDSQRQRIELQQTLEESPFPEHTLLSWLEKRLFFGGDHFGRPLYLGETEWISLLEHFGFFSLAWKAREKSQIFGASDSGASKKPSTVLDSFETSEDRSAQFLRSKNGNSLQSSDSRELISLVSRKWILVVVLQRFALGFLPSFYLSFKRVTTLKPGRVFLINKGRTESEKHSNRGFTESLLLERAFSRGSLTQKIKNKVKLKFP